VGDVAPAFHQHAYLSTDLVADPGELACEFVGDEPVCGQPALDESFEGANLAGLETVGIAEYPDWGAPAAFCVAVLRCFRVRIVFEPDSRGSAPVRARSGRARG
jgi:hypothetical protein